MGRLQTRFQDPKGSETWPEHHNICSLGPKKGTEGLEKAFKGFETGFNGVMTGSNEFQTSFKVPKAAYPKGSVSRTSD